MRDMEKQFNEWNDRKRRIHKQNNIRYCKRRDIVWCALGENIGSEVNGDDRFFKRPVAILKCFGKNTCLVVLITSSVTENELKIPIGKIEGIESFAALSQIRVVDTRRIYKKISKLSTEDFEKIKEAFNNLL